MSLEILRGLRKQDIKRHINFEKLTERLFAVIVVTLVVLAGASLFHLGYQIGYQRGFMDAPSVLYRMGTESDSTASSASVRGRRSSRLEQSTVQATGEQQDTEQSGLFITDWHDSTTPEHPQRAYDYDWRDNTASDGALALPSNSDPIS